MQQPGYFTFGIQTAKPLELDARKIVIRTNEVNAVFTLLSDTQTHTVLLTGMPGAGKSTLAALVFAQLQSESATNQPAFRHFLWVRPGICATWPDVICALLNALKVSGNGSEVEISQRADLQTLYELLCRRGEGALIVLDQCEELFERAIEVQDQAMPYTLGIDLSSSVRFLEMLQQDLVESRIILTCTRSPFGSDYRDAPGVSEYVVGGLTVAEGMHLLQQRNVNGLQQDLAAVWQRCEGHAYTLLLFSALRNLSGLSLHYLLSSPIYQILWEGSVTHNLVEAVCGFFSPVQVALVRVLCLCREAISLSGVVAMALAGKASAEADPRLYEQELRSLVSLGLIEQVEHIDRDMGYQLHPILTAYLLSHYLESEQRKVSHYSASSLGVAYQPVVVQANEESRKIALAAGHMQIAIYYQYLARQTCPPSQQRSSPNEVVPWLAMLEHLCLGWQWQAAYDQLHSLVLDEDLVRWEIWHTLIRLYEMMLPPTGSLKRRDEGLVNSALGMLYSRLGEYEQSRTYYTSALAIQQDMGDHENEVVTLLNQAEFLRTLGDGELARKNLEQVRVLMQTQSNPEMVCILLHNLALLTQQEGDAQQSLSYFMQSLQLAKQGEYREREGLILTNLGLLLCQLGRYQDGLTLLFPALQMRRAQRDPQLDHLLIFLGKVEQRMGNAAFASLRLAAQVDGQQEQVLRMLASVS